VVARPPARVGPVTVSLRLRVASSRYIRVDAVLLLSLVLACRTRSPVPGSDSQSSARDSPVAAGEWQIVPGRSAGLLTETSTEADLRQRYPAGTVDSIRVQLGEGETAPGSVLYPSDSVRRAEILWKDTTQRARPERLILRGSRSLWRVDGGISLGTTLQELERLNGRPFKLAGFGWDYSGVVIDWAGGSLDSSLAGVKLYLDPGPAAYESTTYSQVLGDREYSSDLAPMQQLTPRVYQIFVDFE
jgi:hypothetical protein